MPVQCLAWTHFGPVSQPEIYRHATEGQPGSVREWVEAYTKQDGRGGEKGKDGTRTESGYHLPDAAPVTRTTAPSNSVVFWLPLFVGGAGAAAILGLSEGK